MQPKASFNSVNVSSTLSVYYEPTQSSVTLSTLFPLYDVLNAFCECSGPFELPSYHMRPFVDVKRYTYMLIVCLL